MCVPDDPHTRLRDALVEAGLLVPSGVRGIYGRSGVFEHIVEQFEALVSRRGRTSDTEIVRFPPIFNRAHYLQVNHIHQFPDLLGSLHTFAGKDRAHRDMLVKLEEGGDWIEGALALVSEAALQDYDDAALGGGLTSALDEFVDGGITGVAEVVASPGFDLTRPWIYQELEAAGELDLRVHVYVPVFEPDDIHDAVAWADELDGERVRFAGAKLWVDGSMGTGDSWVSEPLTDDPDDFGSAYFTAEELVEVVADAEALGVPLKLHANGDQAVAVALDAFEEQAAGDGLVLPHTLDHVVLIGADDRARMAELGIVANLQPAHWIGAQAGDVVDQWGEERFDTAYDARALVDAEVTVSIGTDWPVWPSPSAPVNLWAASVVRGPDQGLSREEALTAYTAGSAAGVGQSQLGCLDVGCVADMVTFDSDPLAVDDGALGQLEVTGVWLAGEQVR